MGSIFSTVCHRLRKLAIRTIIAGLRLVIPTLDVVLRSIDCSPGLPVPNPSQPYWMLPPSPISQPNAGPDVRVPEYADVVIIGSGITGTSFAKTILDWASEHRGDPPCVVMLEARDACSGATGRNGGHITPVLYPEYGKLKKKYGMKMAKKIMRFRLAHLPELLAVAEEEGLLEDSQCREVEAFDVFHDPVLYETAKSQLAAYREDLPVESTHYKTYEGEGCITGLQLSPKAVGCYSTRGGAVHPYRLVTGILSRLLKSYPSNFQLYTQTPCIAIWPPVSKTDNSLYQVTTSKGMIWTPHIIHATNGWVSHLLPGMRGKIIPGRGVMTMQRTWTELGNIPINHFNFAPGLETTASWAGKRSFVFYPGSSMFTYDYLTQQPATPEIIEDKTAVYPAPEGELMLGGRFTHDVTAIGSADDRSWNTETSKYLLKVLDGYFEGGRAPAPEDHVSQVWSGILGLSIDENPWVGRIPEKISGRRAPALPTTLIGYEKGASTGMDSSTRTLADGEVSRSLANNGLAAPGEWIAAGYTGEGMVHAWMSGKALAYMVLGLDAVDNGEKGEGNVEEWFPEVFRVTEERWENTGIEDRIEDFISLG